MSQQLTEIDALREYLSGILNRADHHAQNVNEVSLSIAGGVVWRKDDDPLKVMTRDGKMTNVLWFTVNQKRYALSYNHDTAEIELRANSLQGQIVASFSNAMTNAQVRAVFCEL